MDVPIRREIGRAGRGVIHLLGLSLLLGTPALAQFSLTTQPAAAPATQSTTVPVLELRKLLGDLAERDTAVRGAARHKMMGLGRGDLDTLRSVVRISVPLSTAQVSSLREIVLHVFLATEPYSANRQHGFLGVKDLATVKIGGDDKKEEGEDANPAVGGIVVDRNGGVLIIPVRPTEETGVVVSDRVPGFCAYRHLESGDVIVSIKNDRTIRMRTGIDLITTISSHAAGDSITIQVLRRGKTVDVPVTLDAYPDVDPNDKRLDEFRRARETAAEAYWQENFAPLLGDGGGVS